MYRSILVSGIVLGIVAGLVMAMWSMVVTAVMGMGLLAAPAMIAEPLFGSVNPAAPSLVAVVVGLMLHMMFSAVFGVVFLAIWQSIGQGGATAIVGGMIYGVIVWAVMSYIVTPLVGAHIAQMMPVWAWLIAHLMFGGVLGVGAILRGAEVWQKKAV
jgi:hypothetical protein